MRLLLLDNREFKTVVDAIPHAIKHKLGNRQMWIAPVMPSGKYAVYYESGGVNGFSPNCNYQVCVDSLDGDRPRALFNIYINAESLT